jgi:hypothetical protein
VAQDNEHVQRLIEARDREVARRRDNATVISRRSAVQGLAGIVTAS